MAVWYVRSSATGANNGTSWANAYTNIFGAITACAAGDTIYVADDHVGVNSPGTWSKGTLSNPVYIIAAKPTATPPTSVADPGTYATLTSGGDFYCEGCFYIYGIHFSHAGGAAPSVAGNSAHGNVIFENCKFTFNTYMLIHSRSSTAHLSWSSQTQFKNCEVVNNGAQPFNIFSGSGGTFIWRGGKYSRTPTASHPIRVIAAAGQDMPRFECNGVDFSGTGYSTLPRVHEQSIEYGKKTVTNCKLDIGQRVINAGGYWPYSTTQVVNTLHTQFQSTGGASYSDRSFSDACYSGGYMEAFTNSRIKTSPLSHISIEGAGKSLFSYVSDTYQSATQNYVRGSNISSPIRFWNETVGVPITVALNMFIKAGTQSTVERRLEVQYPVDPASPRYAIARTGADLVSQHNMGVAFGSAGTFTGTADTSWIPTFATEGGWPPHYHYNYSVTITPQAKGFIYIRYVKHGSLSEHSFGSVNFNPRPLIS